LANLIIFDISSNPVATSVSNFRLFVIYHLKSLKAMDGSIIVSSDFGLGNVAATAFVDISPSVTLL